MKTSVTSLDCLALARELQPWLGARFEKAFHPAKDELVLRLRQHGQGTREWRVKSGRWAYLSQGTKDWSEPLTHFATQLRSHLDGARLTAIRQVGFDRVLELEFERADGRHVVACELFGEGNVVLTREDKVVQALHFIKVQHRAIQPGQPYVHPPSRLDLQHATDAELHAGLLRSKADAVRTLATEWNLGGQYAEEVCARAGVEKKRKVSQLTEDERNRLCETLRALLAQASERPEPVIVRDGAQMVDCTPVPLATLEQHSFEARGSFSQALEDYFTAHAKQHEQPEDPRVKVVREEQERLQRLIASQEESLAQFDAEQQAGRAAGDLLYGHFPQAESFLAQAKDRARKEGWPALEGWAAEGLTVLRTNPAEGTLVAKLGEGEVELALDRDVHGNAERQYERAKKHREKAEGARAAVAQRRVELAELQKEGSKLADKVAKERAKRRFEPTKKLWFETYRWFITSEGCLALGGRDAQSNDKLVKKHLETNDRYVHADLQGAPSVIVKRGMLPEIGEASLREAAEFSVAYSKAWKSRIGQGEAYWVTPEQVSKTPMPGEYLPKGAFIIRGKRNFLKVPLRAAVGPCEVEGHRKVMGGPVGAVQARASEWVVVEPGTDDPNALANRLSERFQVPLEEVQAVLPPGPLRVVEEKLREG
ncbi:MAG: NFACT family protein [Halobacteriales archaeon]|nr:NFACT family protein [Halobacteriales archaeon]